MDEYNERILEKEEELLEKALDDLLDDEKISRADRFRFMSDYARFKEAMSKVREIDLKEKEVELREQKDKNAYLGEKLKTKLGLIETAIKTGLVAIALWFELKKGAIFGGFMLKNVMSMLFKKSSFTS